MAVSARRIAKSGFKTQFAQVYSADEAFVTGTLGGVTPVTKVDGRVIGDGRPGRQTTQAGELYLRWVTGGLEA